MVIALPATTHTPSPLAGKDVEEASAEVFHHAASNLGRERKVCSVGTDRRACRS
jgi:hypothetical protein